MNDDFTSVCQCYQDPRVWKLLPHTVKSTPASDKLPVAEGKLRGIFNNLSSKSVFMTRDHKKGPPILIRPNTKGGVSGIPIDPNK